VSSSASDDAVVPDRVDRPRWAVVLAWTLFGIAVAGLIARVWLVTLNGAHSELEGGIPEGFVFFSFPAVGVVLATKRPRNPLGWLMLGVGLTFSGPWALYARYAAVTRGGELPGAGLALAFDSPGWVPFIGLSGFMLLLFPNGHLPTPRWRWFAWMCGVGLVILYLTILFSPDQGVDYGMPQIQNPIAIDAIGEGSFLLTSLVFAPLTVAGGAVAIIRRRRRTPDPVQRQQLRWLTWAAGVIAILYVAAFIPAIVGLPDAWEGWMGSVAAGSFVLIPITIGVAVLRYRLYDIDFVIRKTVVFAVVAAFIAIVYVAVVAGVGALVGSGSGPLLSALAAAVVALVFQPVRARARRFADRVVYGKRATPYEVMSTFGDQLAGTYPADDVLDRIAKVLGEGVGARSAEVRLAVGGDLRTVASWPPDAVTGEADYTADVRHQGELLGALAVALPANDPMDPTREQLVQDLASQAGLVLRNVRLTEQLRARLDDLRAAQKRLVAAQDEERRRLERNIHDGAQQQLVALTVKLRLAESLVPRDASKAQEMLRDLQGETQTALEDLRDLARGIYPPLLADKGLVAAVEAQARRSAVPVSMEVGADAPGRSGSDVEAAAYFSILESLQNIAKYADATTARVALSVVDEHLVFEVIDDGRGFDPAATAFGTGLQGIADRLGALDGSVRVVSAPGAGTTVIGRLPWSGAQGPASAPSAPHAPRDEIAPEPEVVA
jgi:signal transduction histidine kinase